MNLSHPSTQNKWHQFTLPEQLANIGAEVGRALNWRHKNPQLSTNALYRALELIDFTINDPKNLSRLSEILRTRELLVDYFLYNNTCHSTPQQWNNYFLPFNILARK